MKKLMVAFAAVFTAVCANAMAFQWTYYDTTGDWVGGEWAGYKVYAVIGSTAQTWDSLEQLQAAAGQGYSIEGSSDVGYAAYGAKTGDFAKEDQSVMFYIVNGDKYIADGAYTAPGTDIYDEGAESPIDPTWYPDNSVAVSGTWSTFGGSDPTPEPTSGLLLLIGVAGLALRRKQK